MFCLGALSAPGVLRFGDGLVSIDPQGAVLA